MADASSPSKSSLSTALWLVLLVLVGFGLRAYFGAQVGFDADAERQMFNGNDPYYHWRTVTNVLETGSNLDVDAGLHYPEGRVNPNPPFWTWTVAPVAVLMDAAGVADPVGAALDTMVALWGALIAIPIFLLARDFWGRTAGMWAAFFATISAPMIDRSAWGYADHDALVTFFTLLGSWFLVRGLKAAIPATEGQAYAANLKANGTALAWGALAAVAFSAVAVTWKGYPYLLGVLAFSLFLTAFMARLRKADAFASYAVHMVTIAGLAVLPWLLYYHSADVFYAKTVQVGLYVLLGGILTGLVLVPTRKVPPIILFPATLLAVVAGIFALRTLAPEIYSYVTTGLGYFEQSRLYSTIGEAQRPQLGTVAAQLGFFTFLLSFWGLASSMRSTAKGQAGFAYITALSVVSIYLMFSASRFVATAAPIFALMLGYPLAVIVGRMGFGDMSRRYRSLHGQNFAARAAKSLTIPVAAWSMALAVIVLLPNLWVGIDAAIPAQYEEKNGLADYGSDNVDLARSQGAQARVYYSAPRFGAVGQSFEMADNGWRPLLDGFAARDAGIAFADRPAAISWWDYGHWIVTLGAHPTVADPFQSHHDFSAYFLTAPSETAGLHLLTILLLDGDAEMNGWEPSTKVTALNAKYPFLANFKHHSGYENQAAMLAGNATGDMAVDLYEDVIAATGNKVGYIAVSDLMFPYDDPQSPGVERDSIFYAPVYLSSKNPDDYLQYSIAGGNTMVREQRYTVDENGDSVSLDDFVYRETGGAEWKPYGDGYLYRVGNSPAEGASQASGIPLTSSSRTLSVTPAFDATMYARAFGGLGPGQAPGDGLVHWRAVLQTVGNEAYTGTVPAEKQTSIRQVVLLEYAQGVKASGKLTGPDGQALAGYTVAFVDGFGATHGSTTTDATGAWSTRAPFTSNGDVSLRVMSASGQTLLDDNGARFQFDMQAAASGALVSGLDVQLQAGSLSGRTFLDVGSPTNSTQPDGLYQAGEEVSDAVVNIAGQTVAIDSDGTFHLDGLVPNTYAGTVTGSNYANRSVSFTVPSGAAAPSQNVSLQLKLSELTLTYLDNGQPVEGVPIKLVGPTETTVTTGLNGTVIANVLPGSYTLKVNATVPATGGVQHVAERTLVVPMGGAPLAATVNRQA